MDQILEAIAALSYDERVELMQRLVAVECGDVPVSDYLHIPRVQRGIPEEEFVGIMKTFAPNLWASLEREESVGV
jgi:hypothetical protein